MRKFKNGIRLTLEEVKARLKRINPNIEIVDDEYKNAKTGLKCKCLYCGHKWKPTWDNLRTGKGCPECLVKSLRTPHSKFVKDVELISPEIEIKTKYKNMKSMMLCKCNIDGTVFKIRADSLMRGFGCPTCSSRAKSKTHEQFVEEMAEVNNYIEITGKYKNKRTKLKCTCRRCNHVWMAWASNLLDGSNCPNCSKPMSNGEIRIEHYLRNKKITYHKEKTFKGCKNDILLRFDFYLPEKNTCIEYDGEQHFRPVEYFGGMDKYKKIKENDNIKNKYCENNNIRLIRIPYTQEDIEGYISKALALTK